MTPELATVFRRPFKEQVAFFAAKAETLVGTARWDDIWQAQHDRAWMVAGAMKGDLLADLYAAMLRAEVDGTTLEAFRKDFRAIVERHGWHGWTGEGTAKGEAWRTRVIYRTNISTSYAAGRWAQLKDAGYPLLIYFHGNSQEPREQHLAWNGLILPMDHPFWVTHAPEWLGVQLLCHRGAVDAHAEILGGNPNLKLPDGWDSIDPRTGAPVGIDKGWAYAPGDSVAAQVAEMAKKIDGWPGAVSAAVLADLPDALNDRIVTAYRRLPSLADALRAWTRRVMEPNPDGFAPDPVFSLGPLLTAERALAGNVMLGLTDAAVARLAGVWSADDLAGLPELLAQTDPVHRDADGAMVWVIDRAARGIWTVTARAEGGALRIIGVEIDR